MKLNRTWGYEVDRDEERAVLAGEGRGKKLKSPEKSETHMI